MGYIFVMVVIVLIIEFFTMVSTYDDFFDNIGWSIFWGFIVTMIIAAIIEIDVEKKPSDQAVQLSEQWGSDIVDDILDIEKFEQQEVDDYYKELEMDDKIDNLVELIESIPSQQREEVYRPVPSTSSYINGSRRNYDVKVTYDIETRKACDQRDDCFKARTVQHTDGTFWACKRNYGTCYEY